MRVCVSVCISVRVYVCVCLSATPIGAAGARFAISFCATIECQIQLHRPSRLWAGQLVTIPVEGERGEVRCPQVYFAIQL